MIGAYAYLGPKAGRDTFGITGETADLTFGGVTVATGVAGTLLGGMLLDRMGASLRNALLICAGGCAIGWVPCNLGFWAQAFKLLDPTRQLRQQPLT